MWLYEPEAGQTYMVATVAALEARLAGMERKSVLPAIADQKIEVQAAEVLARASYGLCTRVAHVHRGQFLL